MGDRQLRDTCYGPNWKGDGFEYQFPYLLSDGGVCRFLQFSELGASPATRAQQ